MTGQLPTDGALPAPGRRPLPDERDTHRVRASPRDLWNAVGRDIAGVLVIAAGIAGVGFTVAVLAGLMVTLLVASVLAIALGAALLYRPDPAPQHRVPRRDRR